MNCDDEELFRSSQTNLSSRQHRLEGEGWQIHLLNSPEGHHLQCSTGKKSTCALKNLLCAMFSSVPSPGKRGKREELEIGTFASTLIVYVTGYI